MLEIGADDHNVAGEDEINNDLNGDRGYANGYIKELRGPSWLEEWGRRLACHHKIVGALDICLWAIIHSCCWKFWCSLSCSPLIS